MKNDSYSPIFLSIPDHPSSLDVDDMFLVIASDGVWDTMSSDLVAKFVIVNTCKIVNRSLEVDENLLRWIARQVSECLFPST